ncbi:MAG: hypothetical protein ACREM1_23050, partial [Longimicrobiales bacterium]
EYLYAVAHLNFMQLRLRHPELDWIGLAELSGYSARTNRERLRSFMGVLPTEFAIWRIPTALLQLEHGAFRFLLRSIAPSRKRVLLVASEG